MNVIIDKDLGFVLKRYQFRDTSLIATLYTLKFGKIRGIFKGFYTIKKEFTSSLDIFTLNEFIFYPRRQELWLVSYADLIYDYPFLRENILKAFVGGVIFNIVDKLVALWEKNPFIFYLLKDSLFWLGKESENKIFYTFLIKFLTLSGFKPNLVECVGCSQELKKDIFFSVSKGGLVCNICAKKIKDIQRISQQVSSSLFYIQKNSFSLSMRLNMNSECEKEIFQILRRFFLYHFDFDIIPKHFLKYSSYDLRR
jgi:DNA repair protein RecO (recombination protein O)